MKCTIFVVLMAVAAASAGSVKTMPAPLEVYRSYPYSYPYAYSAYRSLAPFAPFAPIAPVVAAAPNPVAVDVSSPTYVASNPGVTHVAPLPGHTESVISENPGPALIDAPFYGYKSIYSPYHYYGF